LTAIARFATAVCRQGLRGAMYWLGNGIGGCGRPRIPRRYGYGPYKSAARYAHALALYQVLLTAWQVGTAYKTVWRRARRGEAGATAATVAAQWDSVRHLPVLRPAECATIADRVHELRSLWLLRQPQFYTLGYAAYMDCRDPVSRLRYFEDAPRLNRALVDHFGALYRSVIASLEEALTAPVELAARQAIPGFHVWLGRGVPHLGFDAGSVHFDLQYLDNGLLGERWPTAVDVVSFTLPVRLPKAGGGLNVWDIRHPEPAGREVWPFTRMSRVQYTLGSLVLHTGHELHQIAPVERIEEGDERICLQGLAIRQSGIWLLYW
jgi:hypothetical protein